MYKLFSAIFLAGMLTFSVAAQDSRYPPTGQQIPAADCTDLAWNHAYSPCTATMHSTWLKDITHWRTERKVRVGYSGALYDLPALKWTQSSFIQPQMMV